LYYLREGDRWCGIENQIHLDVAQVFFDGFFELRFYQYLTDAFLNGIGPLQIEGAYSEDVNPSCFVQMSVFAHTPLSGRNDINFVTFIAKFSHKVLVYAMSVYLSEVDHGKEDDVHG
jgi:hypothetical protein